MNKQEDQLDATLVTGTYNNDDTHTSNIDKWSLIITTIESKDCGKVPLGTSHTRRRKVAD